MIPKPIAERLHELDRLVDDNPISIPLEAVASFLHMDGESLKASIDSGNCKFALGWKKNVKGYRAYKIPTVTFYRWYRGDLGGLDDRPAAEPA